LKEGTTDRTAPVRKRIDAGMSKKYRSEAMAAIHEAMEALYDAGAIDKQTMRRFDDACLS
jgi:hypothetical protein